MSVLGNFKLVELITTRTESVITFVNGNLIKFNSATFTDLGYPAYVQFYVDEKNKQVAIKACKETDAQAVKFSKSAAEQKYPIKITVPAVANTVRRVMGWTNEESWNVPGAIFADEGVIIYALEHSFAPVPKSGGWAARRRAEAAADEAAAAVVIDEE